ncbi:hypothetical protein jhhlp_003146 [Lomentospora prolificans]|uniref:SP-RING-type domain-containing protein n=1 Tax=Lomentospora prolificans TaxID=41688 RepID=A0A2N3NG17_9PEZI|nr:hypothetical protein jhhlp_003146 [Lomentospora prolificans]
MLPGKRRLQQGRRTGTSSTPGRPTSTAGPHAELPPYKPQACALNDEAVRSLFQLSQNLKTEKLDEHVRESLAFIGRATFELNETLQSARCNLESLGEGKEEERAKMQKKVTKLEELAKELTMEADKSVRGLIDLKANVVDEREAIQAAHDAASQIVRTRLQEKRLREQRQQELAEAGEQGEDAGDVLAEPAFEPSTDMIRGIRGQKSDEYENMDMYQRYSLNNDYIEFKRQWHMGLHGADAVVPDAKRWFTRDGQPVFNYGHGGGQGGSNGIGEDEETMDDDEDIVIEREKVSTRCPLSLQEMKDPYTNSRCKHTFEKDAIMEFFGSARQVMCPQAGCSMTFTKRDLYPDRAMLARIRRARRERQEPESEEDEDENSRMIDDDGDSRVKEEPRIDPSGPRPRRSIKRERQSRGGDDYDEL